MNLKQYQDDIIKRQEEGDRSAQAFVRIAKENAPNTDSRDLRQNLSIIDLIRLYALHYFSYTIYITGQLSIAAKAVQRVLGKYLDPSLLLILLKDSIFANLTVDLYGENIDPSAFVEKITTYSLHDQHEIQQAYLSNENLFIIAQTLFEAERDFTSIEELITYIVERVNEGVLKEEPEMPEDFETLYDNLKGKLTINKNAFKVIMQDKLIARLIRTLTRRKLHPEIFIDIITKPTALQEKVKVKTTPKRTISAPRVKFDLSAKDESENPQSMTAHRDKTTFNTNNPKASCNIHETKYSLNDIKDLFAIIKENHVKELTEARRQERIIAQENAKMLTEVFAAGHPRINSTPFFSNPPVPFENSNTKDTKNTTLKGTSLKCKIFPSDDSDMSEIEIPNPKSDEWKILMQGYDTAHAEKELTFSLSEVQDFVAKIKIKCLQEVTEVSGLQDKTKSINHDLENILCDKFLINRKFKVYKGFRTINSREENLESDQEKDDESNYDSSQQNRNTRYHRRANKLFDASKACQICKKMSHTASTCYFRIPLGNSNASNTGTNKSNQPVQQRTFCDYHQRTGHATENCKARIQIQQEKIKDQEQLPIIELAQNSDDPFSNN